MAALPEDWNSVDVGTFTPAGTAIYNIDAGRFDLTGAGSDIWGVADQFQYAYQSWSGDGEWVVRVDSVQNTNAWAKAGLMIRENLTPGACHAMVVATPGNGIAYQRRKLADGSSLNTVRTGTAPAWIKIIRRQDQFDLYSSSDGQVWSWWVSDIVQMPPDVLVGLAVTSHKPGTSAAASFSSFTATTPLPAEFPLGWNDQDLGSPTLVGATSYFSDSGLVKVRGAGTDIWGVADQARFVSQTWSGNVIVVTRVDSLINTNAWAKAGVMIRETLGTGSKHATLVITPGNGVAFQRRRTTDGTSLNTARAGLVTPTWLKLERWGDRFDAFISADGLTWSYLGTDTIPMDAGVQIGLVVTSHNPNALTEAAFSHFDYHLTGLPGGLWGEYFQDRTLGTPVLQRIDSGVNFAWGTGAPDASVPANDFSVRWTGTLTPDVTQTYTLYTQSDDGVRLWIDDQLLIDNWTLHGTTENSASVSLEAGQAHQVRMEYFEATGGATARLLWSAADRGKVAIPPSFLRSAQYPDSDGDGLADVIDLYPLDYYNGVVPLITIVGGNNQTALAGEFNANPLDVAVWDPTGTTPYVNAPVTFQVLSGSGQLATTNVGSPSLVTILSVSTDIDGSAIAHYQQPATANVDSQIRASASTAQVVFTSTSQSAGDTTPPAAPGNLEATAYTLTGFTLGWDATTDNVAVTGYDILKDDVAVASTGAATRNHIFTGLAAATTYRFKVKAKDAAGNISAPSSPLDVTMPNYTVTLDDDGDLIPSVYELNQGLNPFTAGDAAGDIDNDLVDNVTEYLQGRSLTKGAVNDSVGVVALRVFSPAP